MSETQPPGGRRRRASRAAGPAGTATTVIEPIAVADEPATSAVTVSCGTGRRPANRARVLALAAVLAVVLAGALTAAVALLTANQRDVDVTRKINGNILTGRVPITDPILAGDTIYVRERLF